MSTHIGKIEAASRQLDTAIRLFFSDGDAVSVHTLAAAAANVFADLLEHRSGGTSWRTRARDDSNLSTAEVKAALNQEWNFFKHADRDPEAVLEFNDEFAADLIFLATLDCGDLSRTSCAMQAFQIWYMATRKFWVPSTHEPFNQARRILPGLTELDRNEQIKHGSRFLQQHCGASNDSSLGRHGERRSSSV